MCKRSNGETQIKVHIQTNTRTQIQIHTELADFPAVFFKLCHGTQQVKTQVQIS